MWARNVQLAAFSVVTGLGTLFLSSDAARVHERGFLQGYTPLTAVCIACNAIGGLLVAMCIKSAERTVREERRELQRWAHPPRSFCTGFGQECTNPDRGAAL